VPEALSGRKAALRAAMRQALGAMSAAERQRASRAACARLLRLSGFRRAAVVMLYMPVPGEVDVTAVGVRAMELHKTVCVPRVDWSQGEMTPVQVESLDGQALEPDRHGVRRPRGGRVVALGRIDLVLVPGLAFDRGGNRLGRGGGFFDRFLCRLDPRTATVAVAFDRQIVDEVPADVRDVRMGAVVTDRRVLRVRRVTHRPRNRAGA
jgi:5-formyltetrahydrofolate cyclo-ligase